MAIVGVSKFQFVVKKPMMVDEALPTFAVSQRPFSFRDGSSLDASGNSEDNLSMLLLPMCQRHDLIANPDDVTQLVTPHRRVFNDQVSGCA